MPFSKAQIAESKMKLEVLAKKEEDVAAVAALKNELEAAPYEGREKLEREDVIKVSTEEQRGEISKICTESEEWMHEAHYEKQDYEKRLTALKDLLGPIEERASELEARAELPEAVTELVDLSSKMRDTIKKDMPWVMEPSVTSASKMTKMTEKLQTFEDWWAKKQAQQNTLPLSEAPAFTKKEVMDEINGVHKEFKKLLAIKKPKAKKNSTKSDKEPTKTSGAEKEAPSLPADAEATTKELETLRAEKKAAVENEDFDKAASLKVREKALEKHLASFDAEKSEL